MANGKRKGNAFERDICRELSLWWTADLDEPRDDIFWKTSNSGGRATARTKSSKKTHGQYGDVCAIDPIGQPLVSLLTLELKSGYSRFTFADLIDKPAHAKQQQYEVWFEKAQKDSEASGSAGWLLITRRDRRVPLVFMTSRVADKLKIDNEGLPCGQIECISGGLCHQIVVMTLEEWLTSVAPEHITNLAVRHRKG